MIQKTEHVSPIPQKLLREKIQKEDNSSYPIEDVVSISDFLGSEKFATPEKAFQTWKDASLNEDFPTFKECIHQNLFYDDTGHPYSDGQLAQIDSTLKQAMNGFHIFFKKGGKWELGKVKEKGVVPEHIPNGIPGMYENVDFVKYTTSMTKPGGSTEEGSVVEFRKPSNNWKMSSWGV